MKSTYCVATGPPIIGNSCCTFWASIRTPKIIPIFILLNVSALSTSFPALGALRPFSMNNARYLSNLNCGRKQASCPSQFEQNKSLRTKSLQSANHLAIHERLYSSRSKRLGMQKRVDEAGMTSLLQTRSRKFNELVGTDKNNNAATNLYLTCLNEGREAEKEKVQEPVSTDATSNSTCNERSDTLGQRRDNHDDTNSTCQWKELEKEEEIQKEEVAQKIEQEKEELQAAVQEVKEAVQEVSQSATKLGGAVINNGPGIFTRFFSLLVSEEMRNDVLRRRKHYLSDWTDAFGKKRQVVPAVLFLYFACLAPIVSFGTISSEITNGSIGVVEFLLSSGVAGMMYAVLCGQPMAFIAPTGLTLAFISGLFRFCTLRDLPFYPVYAWVGLWTSAFMTLLGISGSSKLIRFCTRFTDEVFNGLLSVNFIYEAVSSLKRNFERADPMNLTMPFVALSMALGTFFSTMSVVKFEASKYFNSKIRTGIKNFGPVTVILFFTILNRFPWFQKFNVPTLSAPEHFQLAGGRNFLVGLKDIPVKIRMLCALPAFLLTGLFFMDQNISVRLVNNPDNKLKKGEAYNLDMVALGIITGVLSIFGLPWMCGATVQSMNHVRAMAETKLNEETKQIEIDNVTETRTTGFTIHALLASSILLLPLIRNIPIPVVSGVFLFLGRKLMTGNTFFKRILYTFAESNRLPDDNPISLVGRKKMNIYTGVQILCLLGLFGFKQIPAITIFFPTMIAILMLIRSFVLPHFFSEKEFVALGDPSPT